MKKILEILKTIGIVIVGTFIAAILPVVIASHYENTYFLLLYIITFPIGVKILFNEAEKPLISDLFDTMNLIR